MLKSFHDVMTVDAKGERGFCLYKGMVVIGLVGLAVFQFAPRFTERLGLSGFHDSAAVKDQIVVTVLGLLQ